MTKKEIAIFLSSIIILTFFSYMENREKYDIDLVNSKGNIIKPHILSNPALPEHGFEFVDQLPPPTPQYDPAGLEWMQNNTYQPRHAPNLSYLFSTGSNLSYEAKQSRI